jgi:hypothetical protein
MQENTQTAEVHLRSNKSEMHGFGDSSAKRRMHGIRHCLLFCSNHLQVRNAAFGEAGRCHRVSLYAAFKTLAFNSLY